MSDSNNSRTIEDIGAGFSQALEVREIEKPMAAKLTMFSKGSTDIRFAGIWFHVLNTDIQLPYPGTLEDAKRYIAGILDDTVDSVPYDNVAGYESEVDQANVDLVKFREMITGNPGQATFVFVGEELIARLEIAVAFV